VTEPVSIACWPGPTELKHAWAMGGRIFDLSRTHIDRLVEMTLALGDNRPAWMLDAERQLAESAGLRRLAAMMDLPEELLACRGQHPHPGLEWLGKRPAGGKTDV